MIRFPRPRPAAFVDGPLPGLRGRLAPVLAGALALTLATAALPEARAASAPAVAPASAAAVPIKFGGTTYLHRWSKDNQNEFTPVPEADLDNWNDMVTIIVYDAITDPDGLASAANTVLTHYQQGGTIIHTNSVPETPSRPAEHLIVAGFVNQGHLEIAFTRFRLVGGIGEAVVYSHRIYSKNLEADTSTWLKAHGQQTEDTLMKWTDVPSIETLKALPQSTGN